MVSIDGKARPLRSNVHPVRLFSLLKASLANPTFLKIALGFALFKALSKLSGRLSDRALGNHSPGKGWDWQKEIVLITGGSNGIGESVTRQLAARGITVIVFDRTPAATSFPPNVHFYEVDITDSGAVHTAAESLRRDVGEPTVLVNNAGVGYVGSIFDKSEGRVRKTFEVNTIAHFTLAREFVPSMMRNDHGHVVTVASMSSFVTVAGNVDYSCSKVSAMAFHEGLRQDLVHRHGVKHVRTSIIHPFWVKTRMTQSYSDKLRGLGEELLEPKMVADRIVAQIMLGKSGRVIIPDKAWPATLVRALPDWLQERVRSSRSAVMTQ